MKKFNSNLILLIYFMVSILCSIIILNLPTVPIEFIKIKYVCILLFAIFYHCLFWICFTIYKHRHKNIIN